MLFRLTINVNYGGLEVHRELRLQVSFERVDSLPLQRLWQLQLDKEFSFFDNIFISCLQFLIEASVCSFVNYSSLLFSQLTCQWVIGGMSFVILITESLLLLSSCLLTDV